MKLHFVELGGIAIALSTVFLLVPWAATGESVLVFGHPFTVSNPSVNAHDSSYLKRVGLTTLNIKRMDADAESLALMTGHVLGDGNKLESEFMETRSIQFLVLYAYQMNEGYGIKRQNTQGVSVCYIQGGVPYLALYEQKAGKMVAIPQYHLRISGSPRVDDLRLLHFSFADSAETLPASTEIYLVRNEVIVSELMEKTTDDGLRLQLLTDSDRNAGRFASNYFMGQSYFEGLDDLVIPRTQIFYLRDKVLMESRRGQEYIRGAYHFGSLHKRTPGLLVKYAALLPKIEQIVQTLEHGNGSKIVLDRTTATEILEIIEGHRDVPDSPFQEFLDLIEVDTEALTGKTKSDLLAYLKQPE